MRCRTTSARSTTQVRALLHVKQVLGGSSLKKLQVILDTTGEDGRLHDQYLHIGAGATYRDRRDVVCRCRT